MDYHSKPATCTNSTSTSTQNNEFVGYINKASPVYNEKFFECQLQGRDETITGATCFSRRKHKVFADYGGKKSPIKVNKFILNTSLNTNDMLMEDHSCDLFPAWPYGVSQNGIVGEFINQVGNK